MISCKRATELLSQQMDQDLSRWQTLVLRFHLMMCSNCREFSRQMEELRSFSAKFMARPGRSMEDVVDGGATESKKNNDPL